MSPHAYLRRRLKSLFLWYGDPPGLDEVLAEKFMVDEMAVTLGSDDDGDDRKERERFAVIEAEVLLHHVSETLLRIYLVHAKGSPCPWLDISRETNFAVFKKEVGKLRERLEDGTERSHIENVFFTTTERESLTPIPDQEIWEAASHNVGQYLDYYAAHFLDSAPYNAAKHGLALMAGPTGIQLGAGHDLEPFLLRSGPALEYLAIEKDSGSGDPKWAHVTKWIVLRRALAMIHMGCNLLEGIWIVGADRRTKKKLESLQLFNEPRFEDVMNRTEYKGEGGIHGVMTDRISERLLYYEPAGSARRT